jgi:hypothetical protein
MRAVGVHCRGRRACMDGRPPATATCPALLRGAAAVSAADGGVRPGPGRNPDVQRTRPGCPVPRTRPGFRPGRRSRQTPPVRRCGQWTRPADTRNPQAAGTVDTRDCGRAHGHCGMDRRTLRQRPAGQPSAEPSTAACVSGRERDRKVRHRPAPPWPDRQIRSLGAAGKPASSYKGGAGWDGSAVKVRAGSARQNIDRVVDRAGQAPPPRAPDRNLVLSGSAAHNPARACATPRRNVPAWL